METDQIRRKNVYDMGWSSVSAALSAVASFVLSLIIGNVFATEGLGVYSLTISLYTTITVIASLGIGTALVKFVAEFKKNRQRLGQLVSASVVTALVLGVLTSIAIITITNPLAMIFGILELTSGLPLIAVAIPFFLFNKVLFAFLNGLREMRLYALAESGRYCSLVVFTGIMVWRGFGINGAIVSIVLSELLVSIVLFIMCFRLFTFALFDYWKTAKILLGFGLQILATNVIAALYSRMPLLLVGWLLSKSDVGIYAAAMMFATVLLMMPSAIQRVTTPAISEYDSQSAHDHISHLINDTMKYSLLFLGVAALIFGLLIEDIIRVFYPSDPDFLAAAPLFRIIALAIVVRGVQVSLAGAFVSVGKPHITIALSASSLAMLVVSGLILIPTGGLMGAALSVTLTYFVMATLFFLSLRRTLKVRPRFDLLILIFLLLVFSYGGGLLLKEVTNVYIGTSVALVLFILVLVLTRIVGRNDLRLIFGRRG